MIQNTGADFTIADVLAWARTKPADEAYDYTDGEGGCALCQFLKDTGRSADPSVYPYIDGQDNAYAGWRHEEEPLRAARPYPQSMEPALSDRSKSNADWTFGGLVARLEKLCPETPVTKPDWLTIDAYAPGIEQWADIEQVSV